MNGLDYILVAILGYCLVRGVFRGLIKELSSIVGVLGGYYAAYSYYGQMAKPLGRWITDAGYLSMISFLIIFVAVYLAISIAGAMIKYLMNIAFLGWADRIGGAFCGALKGMLMVVVLIAVLTAFLPSQTALLKNSVAARNMMVLSAAIVQAAPRQMKTLFGAKMKEYHLTWQHKRM